MKSIKGVEHKVTWIWPCTILYCLTYGRTFINKFSKQIANSFAKIINSYKSEFKGMSNSRDGAFSASCYRLQRWTQNLAKYGAKDGIFCRNSQKLKTIHYFGKNHHLGCLTRFLICFWIGFQRLGCFIFKSIWISRVINNLPGKTK